MSKIKTMTREQWLTKMLHDHIAPLLARHGANVPVDAKVSVGFPGGGSARTRIGECWTRKMSSIGVNEIFISPTVKDVKKIVDVLIHEAVHASDNCESGHKGHFAKVARSVGFDGKLTSTHAGPVLAEWIESKIEAMPAFEYGSLDLSTRKKKQTYMLKLECDCCGAIIRTTAQWLPNVAGGRCGCGGDFKAA